MATLGLAVDIAEVISKAANDSGPLDIDATAADLVEAHPDADATRDEVADALREEGEATGVIPPKPADF